MFADYISTLGRPFQSCTARDAEIEASAIPSYFRDSRAVAALDARAEYGEIARAVKSAVWAFRIAERIAGERID
jgi:hypothetical protein